MTANMHICKLDAGNPIVKDPARLPMKSLVRTKIHVGARCLGHRMESRVDGCIGGGIHARPGSDSLVPVRRADIFSDA